MGAHEQPIGKIIAIPFLAPIILSGATLKMEN